MAQAQQLNNYAQTTLASGCTNVAVTLSVVSVAGWPTVGNFMLRIDDAAPATTFEYVEVTSVNVGANQVTVTRAQEGTTGIAHLAGAFVGNDLTAAMLGRYVPWGMQLYKARGYRNAALNLTTSGVWQKIALDTKNYDPNTNLDVVTNNIYTAPVAGYYVIVGQISVAVGSATLRIGARLNKNNGTILASNLFVGNAANLASTVTTIESLAASDTIQLEGYQEIGANQALNIGTTAVFLAIHYLSAP